MDVDAAGLRPPVQQSGLETARALVMMTPDIGAQFFVDVAAVAAAGGPPDRTKLMEVAIRTGACRAEAGADAPAH